MLYEEIFDKQFRNAIRYGMTPKQFWEEYPQLYYTYEGAYKDELEEQLEIADMHNWELGQYMMMGVAINLGAKLKYPKNPMFHKHEVELTEEQKARKAQVAEEIRLHNEKTAQLRLEMQRKYGF